MASKRERINKIIDDLEKERHYDSPTSSMTRDGIVGSEEEYSGITVVLKETPDKDFAAEISDPNGIEPKNLFSYNFNKIKYAIEQALNGGKYDDDMAESIKKKKISGIGYVNLKKKAEEHYNTPNSDVIESAERDGPYLKAEINVLEPKIIYCAGKNVVYDSLIKLYPELDGKEIYNKDGIHIFNNDGKRLVIVDGSHPSDWSRFDAKKIYNDLSKPEVQIQKIKDQEDSALKDIQSGYEKNTEKKPPTKHEKEDHPKNDSQVKHENFSSVKPPVINSVGGGGAGISIDPKIIGIIVGVVILIILLLLLLRNCGKGKQQPDHVVEQTVEQVQPQAKEEIPGLTYDYIHFVKDTRFFLSEGNYYIDTPPDMSEGRYEDRLKKVADDMKRVLTVVPGQIFIITGYVADAPESQAGEIELSTQRTEKVKAILVEFGVPLKNLQCIYAGSTSKWGNNLSEETRKPNRVVTIELKK